MNTEETRNCPNCGAVIEKDKNKCPYCGTSYFDFTNIDLSNHKLFYMKLKIPSGIMTAKVVAIPTINIDFISDDKEIMIDKLDVKKYCVSPSLNIHIDFQAIMEDGALCKLEVKK